MTISFSDTPIEDEKLNRIAEKINLCPSAGNRQSFHVFVVKNKEIIESICKATSQGWVQQAPCVMVFCCETKDHYYGKRGLELYTVQDSSIAQTYAMLACQEEGLKSCWVGSFDESEISAIIKMPSHLRPVGLLPCGYSTSLPRHDRARKEVKESFTFIM